MTEANYVTLLCYRFVKCQIGGSTWSIWKGGKPGSKRNYWWMYEDQD